jgi:hypothetical protein
LETFPIVVVGVGFTELMAHSHGWQFDVGCSLRAQLDSLYWSLHVREISKRYEVEATGQLTAVLGTDT